MPYFGYSITSMKYCPSVRLVHVLFCTYYFHTILTLLHIICILLAHYSYTFAHYHPHTIYTLAYQFGSAPICVPVCPIYGHGLTGVGMGATLSLLRVQRKSASQLFSCCEAVGIAYICIVCVCVCVCVYYCNSYVVLICEGELFLSL